MATILRETVEERITNGYKFDLGEYLSEGFQLFQKEWVMFSLYGLVSSIILVCSLFTVIGFAFVLYPTLLGFSIAAEKVEKEEPLEFNDFFAGFKNIGQHFVLGLIVLFSYALIVAIYFGLIFFTVNRGGESSNDPAMAMAGMGLMMIIIFVIVGGIYLLQIALFFAPYLIHYGDYQAGEAIKKSFALSKKNFWWMLLFIFIVGVVAGIGQYACVVGMFATMAIGALMNYALVKKTLMNNEHSEIDEIGSTSY
ncbi:MAG: DUF4013 domain-containing protein [Moheibacter sp.]